VGSVRDRELATSTQVQTEVYPLATFAIGGMMLFTAANDLLIMFVALEVLSLPLYLISGMSRRRRLLSQEAAVKYFLLGAFASAFFLYGLALVYGATGSIRLGEIRTASATGGSDVLLLLGLGLLVVGLLFKASVAPFHSWTPDVYQGAPTPVTAFMAACTKVAAFGAILRLLYVAFGTSEWSWRPLIYGVAIVSMIVGAVKR
jgi:NADH-quinone oxidoreductase subunit N